MSFPGTLWLKHIVFMPSVALRHWLPWLSSRLRLQPLHCTVSLGLLAPSQSFPKAHQLKCQAAFRRREGPPGPPSAAFSIQEERRSTRTSFSSVQHSGGEKVHQDLLQQRSAFRRREGPPGPPSAAFSGCTERKCYFSSGVCEAQLDWLLSAIIILFYFL